MEKLDNKNTIKYLFEKIWGNAGTDPLITFYNGSDDDDEKTVPNGTLLNPRGSLPYSSGTPSYVGSPFSGHKSTGINKDAWLPWDDSKPINQDLCYHEWKQYTGLSETFRYCTKCDKKKP